MTTHRAARFACVAASLQCKKFGGRMGASGVLLWFARAAISYRLLRQNFGSYGLDA